MRVKDYSIVVEIGHSSSSKVYRALGLDGLEVALKVAKKTVSDDHILRQLRREAALVARVGHPSLPKIFEVGSDEGVAYLAMEYIEGRSLADLLLNGPMSETALVQTARQIAEALKAIHSLDLIHRDIKPDNIMIDRKSSVRLIDFGLMGILHLKQKNQVVGTLLYSAPEQSGTLARPVDERSDLYSLGVVMYEMASGRRPFESSDVGELLNMHATRSPPNLRTIAPHLSAGIVSIIEKLLHKDPDDRYLCAASLIFDLEHLNTLNEALTNTNLDLLGKHHAHQSESYIHSFIGRETLLKDIKKHTHSKRVTMTLLEGEQGSGKTRLVREALKEHSELASVWYGTCSETATTPLEVLKNLHCLTNKTPLLAEFENEFALCVKAADSQEMLANKLADLLIKYSEKQGELTIVLDDFHWIDPTSSSVINFLLEKASLAPLRIIALARTDQGNKSFSNIVTLHQRTIEKIVVPPLTPSELDLILQSALGTPTLNFSARSKLIADCHNGAATLIHVMNELFDRGILYPKGNNWLLDEADYKSLPLPKTTLETVIAKLETLDSEKRHILCYAAILGMHFSLSDCADLFSGRDKDVLNALQFALDLKLIEYDSNSYTFSHADIQHVILQGMQEHGRREANQICAEMLLKRQSIDNESTMYRIAKHFEKGNDAYPELVARYNQTAGDYAARAHAFEEAYSFYKVAESRVVKFQLHTDYKLYVGLAESCIYTARSEEAKQYIQVVLERSRDSLLRSRLQAHLVSDQLYGVGKNIESASFYLKRGFREINKHPMRGTPIDLISALFFLLLGFFIDRTGIAFGTKQPEKLEKLKVLAILNQYGGTLAFLKQDNKVRMLYFCRAFYYAARLGECPNLVLAYSHFASAMAFLKFKRLALYYSNRATSIGKKIEDPFSLASAILQKGLTCIWSGLTKEAEKSFSLALAEYRIFLRQEERLYTNIVLDSVLKMTGDSFALLHFVGELQSLCDEAEQRGNIVNPATKLVLLTDSLYAHALRGNIAEASRLEEQLANVDVGRSPLPQSYKIVSRLIYLWEQREFDEPFRKQCAEFDAIGFRLSRIPQFGAFALTLIGYILAEKCLEQKKNNRPPELDELRLNIKKQEQTAVVPYLVAHLLVQKALLQQLTNQPKRAFELLNKAEKISLESSNNIALFEIARQKALLYKQNNNADASRWEAGRAFALASQYGWEGRQRRLKVEFDLSSGSRNSSTLASSGSSSSSRSSSLEEAKLRRQLDALLQLSISTSGILSLEKQATIVLQQTLKISNAERAYLFLKESRTGSLQFRAGVSLTHDKINDAKEYSTKIIENVFRTGQAIVVTGTESRSDINVTESITLHNLKSIIAFPLCLRSEVIGVVYLDNRLAKGIFTSDDLDILNALSTHIAHAFESAAAAQQEMERQLAHAGELSKLVVHGKTISSCATLPLLGQTLNNAFSAMLEAKTILDIRYSALCFSEKLAPGLYAIDAFAKPIENSKSLNPANDPATPWLKVIDPRTNEELAQLNISSDTRKLSEKDLSLVQSLSNNAANAISAIRLVDALHVIERKTSEIRTVFSTISQGICSVDEQGRLGPDYSLFCENLSGKKELAGESLISLFFTNSDLTGETLSQIESCFLCTVGNEEFLFSAHQHLLPRQFCRKKDIDSQIIEVDWVPMLKPGTEIVSRVMVVFRDVTDMTKLKEDTEKRQRELQWINEVLGVSLAHFENFTRDASTMFETVSDVFSAKDVSENEMNHAKRALHTIKGTSRILGLSTLSGSVHQCEEALQLWLNSKESNDKQTLASALHTSRSVLKTYIDLNSRLLARGGHGTNWSKSSMPFETFVAPFLKSCEQMALDLNKDKPIFLLSAEGFFVEKELHSPLSEILTHVLRNSVDHGLKQDQRGEITIQVSVNDDRFANVTVFDNGRGLNLKRLREKGSVAKIISGNASDQEVAELIFHPGLSTANKVSEISGRGVGMDAVRKGARDTGGDILLILDKSETAEPGFCKFRLVIQIPQKLLPYSKVEAA